MCCLTESHGYKQVCPISHVYMDVSNFVLNLEVHMLVELVHPLGF